MTPGEHLAWAKDRADRYITDGDPINALASMLSDLSKHPETAHLATTAPMATDPRRIQQWIDGFGSGADR